MSVWSGLEASRAATGVQTQIASGEPAHATLLLGPAGSGKRSVALAIAAALNCTDSPGEGCGTCRACRRILNRSHPDVHHIVPEGPLIPVDVIREVIIPEAARSPFEGRYKVFIIEEADRMNAAAQNALLKTLEEPHQDTCFVLLSADEDEVLETVRSRCRVSHMDPLPFDHVVDVLRGEGADDDTARLAASLAEGDLERARLLAFDASVRERRRKWLAVPRVLISPAAAVAAAQEILDEARAAVKERGKAQKKEIEQLAEATGEGRGTAAARNALTTRHKRELRRLEQDVLGEALVTVGQFYRDVLSVRTGAFEAVVNSDRGDDLRTWASSAAGDAALIAAAERCLAARASLGFNANVPLAIESTLVELSQLAPPPAASAA